MDIMPASAFGVRLRELRKAAGLTQAELAGKAGLHRQAIAKFELGERDPQWQSVLALATALGTTPDAFQQPPPAAVPRGRGRPPKPSEPPAPPAKKPRKREGRKGE